MLRHYFTTAFRSFYKNASYSIINVFGLTLGVTCALTILLYVYDELTFDHNHQNINNIYRLNGGWRSMTDASSNMYAGVGYIVGEKLAQEFPEIDHVVRMRRFFDMRIENPGTGDFFLENVHTADSNIFKVFTLPFIAGTPEHALSDKNSMVISRKAALKYFNSTDVIGKTLRWLRQDTLDLKITGVMEDYPDNTHIKIDFLTRLIEPQNLRDEWFQYQHHTFFTLIPQTDISAVESRINSFTKPYVADFEKEIGFTQQYTITPLSKIHLYSNLPLEWQTNGKASYVYIFLIVGLFILAMACINFMNLATARSMVRAKEIGLRKVVGAIKRQLVAQFMGEALLMTLLATAISIIAVYSLLPYLNDFTSKQLTILYNRVFWSMVGGIIIVVSLLAGSYPAFFLSAFQPVQTLKGSFKTSDRGNYLRKSLVIFQFCISVALIAGTLIIMNHLKFLRTKDLGFNKDQIVILTGANQNTKERLLTLSGVAQASLSNRVPGNSVGGTTIHNGWDASDPQVVIGKLAVDYDFIDLYGLKLLEGRTFSKEIASDVKEAFIINETALKTLDIPNAQAAIGHELWTEDWGGKKGRIIGVLKDFHFVGVNASIEPFIMFLHENPVRNLSVKISGANLQDILQQIENIYKETVTGRPFEYSFLDQSFDQQYKSEERFMTVFSIFAMIGILIGCLGLYGLAMFMAEQRTREVGVRKVLGASEKNIFVLLTSDFLRLIAVAFIIAIPVAYYAMEQWLNGFPYRENINPLLFLITAIVVTGIALLTVGYQALKAASTNPVKTLRSQ